MAALKSVLSIGVGISLASAALHPLTAQASPELDRRYALQSVGVLKSTDNVDGLFSDYVARALSEYFKENPRFVLHDLAAAQALLDKTKLPYSQLIEDQQVLEKVARASRSETLVRAKVFKEGARYRFTIDWLHSPKMHALGSDVFFLEEPRNGSALGAETIRAQLQAGMERAIAQVPFQAQITGRDGDTVTLNAAKALILRPGDTVKVGTIDDVKRHPLLKVLAEWKISRTGTVEIQSVDQGMAFGRIKEEDSSRPIARGQKITQVLHLESSSLVQKDSERDQGPMLDRTDPPRIGWISAAPLVGTFDRQLSAATGTPGSEGGGLALGARSDAVIWLNREWLTEMGMSYAYLPYSQGIVGSGTSSDLGSGSLFQYKLGAGYSYLPGRDFFAAKGWIKGGYQSLSYTFPKLSAEGLNPIRWSGIYVGVGGDLPLRQGWGLQMNLDFGLLRSVTETGSTRSPAQGSTLVTFYLGTFYSLKPRLLLRLGIDFQAQSADFNDGTSLSHRMITFLPSLVVPF
ncbi:MAG: hypothetical protein RJB38_2128 [Pseudomonadota bacterium]|jgi:hypothetical protein